MPGRFEENFIIQLPIAVKDDQELLWIERIAFFFFVRYDGDGAKVRAELGVKERRMREIKSHLWSRGHISRIVDEKNQIRYVPIDANAATWEKIKLIREKSQVGLKKIGDQNILAWQRNHSLQFILQQLEVIEWTYRKSKTKKIEKPHHLITSILNKNGTNPPDDFVPGFWDVETQKKNTKQKTDLDLYKEGVADEAFAREQIKKIRNRLEEPTMLAGVRG